MDVAKRLLESGFGRVIAVEAALCPGAPDHGTLFLALWPYEAEQEPDASGPWVHPYYPQSQRAYMAARTVAEETGTVLRDDIQLKPIFARLPMFTQGRNTLSYTVEYGSRFHVQTLYTEELLAGAIKIEENDHELHCGNCRACMDACPTHAIDEDGFHRERCIRNWMLTGKEIPEEVRSVNGTRFIGCDECQRCCPHNRPAEGETASSLLLGLLLSDTKKACELLRPLIGVNLSIPNRVLSQACIIAGNCCDASLLPMLEPLAEHSSPVVREHAAWAMAQLKNK